MSVIDTDFSEYKRFLNFIALNKDAQTKRLAY